MKRRIGLVVSGLLLLAVMGAAAAQANAAQLYVDADTGSDAGPNTCTVPASPCQTIGHAATQPGEVNGITIDDGLYLENVVLTAGQSLIYSNYIFDDFDGAVIDGGTGTAVSVSGMGGGVISGLTIRGNSDRITINSYTQVQENTFDDPDANSGVDVVVNPAATHTEITGNHFEDPNPSTTRGRMAVYALASGMQIHDNEVEGMNVGIQTGGTGSPQSVVEGNTITQTHNLPFSGRAILAGNGTLVRENTISDPFDSDTNGIDAGGSTQLERNLVVGHRVGVWIGSDMVNVSLDGDLITGNTYRGIYAFDNNPIPTRSSFSATNVTVFDNAADLEVNSSDATIDSSIFGDAFGTNGGTCLITHSRGDTIGSDSSGCDSFQTSADPMFVDAGAGDYHLQPGSPLIDLGNPAAPPEGAVDRDGDPRAVDGTPSCVDTVDRRDIGYDEYTPEGFLDCEPPQTTFLKKPKGKVPKKTKKVKFKLGSSEPESTFECKFDKKSWKPCGSSVTVKLKKSRGSFTFQAKATDVAGNTDPTPAKHKFRLLRK